MLERFMWVSYPKSKPKKSGEYLCIIKYGIHRFNRCVMLLHYDNKKDIWKDWRRQNVFTMYDVQTPWGEKLYSDYACIRDDVIFWRSVPKMKGERR